MPETATFDHAIPVERGCGRRKEGGVYIETGLPQKGGSPLEDFILDPPVPIPDGLSVPVQGMGIIERNGVYHLVDRVGSVYYPNVADFVEEVRRCGLSRRIQSNFTFELLTAESRILLIHERAIVENWSEVDNLLRFDGMSCPKKNLRHVPSDGFASRQQIEEYFRTSPPPATCAGVWWETLEEGDLVSEEMARTYAEAGNRYHRVRIDEERTVERRLPSLSYLANLAPAGFVPRYSAGFFLTLPISGISVVRAAGGQHIAALDRARLAGLPVDEVAM